ncbi:MAG: hypothetical protein ACTHQ3_14550 [Motilibacteraceae bacterium]
MPDDEEHGQRPKLGRRMSVYLWLGEGLLFLACYTLAWQVHQVSGSALLETVTMLILGGAVGGSFELVKRRIKGDDGR